MKADDVHPPRAGSVRRRCFQYCQTDPRFCLEDCFPHSSVASKLGNHTGLPALGKQQIALMFLLSTLGPTEMLPPHVTTSSSSLKIPWVCLASEQPQEERTGMDRVGKRNRLYSSSQLETSLVSSSCCHLEPSSAPAAVL